MYIRQLERIIWKANTVHIDIHVVSLIHWRKIFRFTNAGHKHIKMRAIHYAMVYTPGMMKNYVISVLLYAEKNIPSYNVSKNVI